MTARQISRRACFSLAAGAAAFAVTRARADAPPVLDQFPLTVDGDVTLTGSVVVTLYRDDPAQLVAAMRAAQDVVSVATDSVRVKLSAYRPALTDKPQAYTHPSFLLDYDDPGFEVVAREARTRAGATPTAEQLAKFVGEYITTKNRARGFDIASTVAKRREGDCTEHAVLLAALLRQNHIPARVVLGLAFVEWGQRPGAFGHAWVEAHDGAWHAFDAAAPDARHRLPLFAVTNETAGYQAPLFAKNQALLPRKIVLAAA